MKPSNLRVPSEENFWIQVSVIRDKKSCWLWAGHIDMYGYGRCVRAHLHENKAHRLSWIYSVGPIPKGMKVLHKCDVPACVRPNHLFIGTQRDNILDCEKKGRAVHPTGEAHACSKLTAEIVRKIRKRFDEGASEPRVAAEFGIVKSHARRIKLGESWASVK